MNGLIIIISSPQDGNVRLHDLRDSAEEVLTFRNFESVRDVQYNPGNGDVFVAGTDNSTVFVSRL